MRIVQPPSGNAGTLRRRGVGLVVLVVLGLTAAPAAAPATERTSNCARRR